MNLLSGLAGSTLGSVAGSTTGSTMASTQGAGPENQGASLQQALQNPEFEQLLQEQGRQLAALLEQVQADPDAVDPQLLSMLQQWLSGKELPHAASPNGSLQQDLPTELPLAELFACLSGDMEPADPSATESPGVPLTGQAEEVDAVPPGVPLPISGLAPTLLSAESSEADLTVGGQAGFAAALAAPVAGTLVSGRPPASDSLTAEEGRLAGQVRPNPIALDPAALQGQGAGQQQNPGQAQTQTQPGLNELLSGLNSGLGSSAGSTARPGESILQVALPVAQVQVPPGTIAATGMEGLLPGAAPSATTQLFSTPLTGSLLSMNLPQTVGSPDWGPAVGERLIWMVKGDQQMAQLKISPPNLGPLEVKLTINNDQASVSFVSNHAAVRDALEAAIPRLREMFGQESLNLANVDVGSGQQRQAHGDTGQAAAWAAGRDDGDGVAEPLTGMPEGLVDASGMGLIDLFA